MNKKVIVSLCLLAGVFVCGAADVGSAELYETQKQVKYDDKTAEERPKTMKEETAHMQDDRKAIEDVYLPCINMS